MKPYHSLLAPVLGVVLMLDARAGGIFDDPEKAFPNSLLPVLSGFEKARIETTLRGFFLRADIFPEFENESDPSDAGLYLNVAVRDPEEIPTFKDSSKVLGEVTERTVEFPAFKGGEVALRVVFKFGKNADPEAIKAIGKDIEALIKACESARGSKGGKPSK